MKLQWDLWFRIAKWVGTGLAATALTWIACAQGVSTTTVQGTLYLANGKPGSGSLQLSWPAFTTSDNRAVAAGRMSAAIGQDGNLSVNLAPNLGSNPAGLYYTVVFHLSDGTTSTEYWVVPPADQVSIAQVRAQVMPAAQAVQAVSKAYVDQAIQSVSQGSLTSTGGSLTGPLYLNGDPTVPLQAADKRYVDAMTLNMASLSTTQAQSFTGPVNTPSIKASVNTEIFVQATPYNAYCDGVHDDNVAIAAALSDAAGQGRAVAFPAGTCLTSTITNYLGQSFHGAGKLLTRIVGKPGQDVFQGPNAPGTAYLQDTDIHDLSIITDNTVNAAATAGGGNNTFPNRISGTSGGGGTIGGAIIPLTNPPAIGPEVFGPGTYGCTETSITAGTNVLNCTGGDPQWDTLGDGVIGLPITVNGAGTSGGNLTTTITGYTHTSLTLAGNASTTPPSTAGGSFGGTTFAPPWYFGNCGIAMPLDDYSWLIAGPIRMHLKNVAFGNIGSPDPRANHTCGMWIQAQWYNPQLEGVDVENMYGGIIEALPLLHSYTPFLWSPDTATYKDLNFVGDTLPMVTYNGSGRVFDGISIYGGERLFTYGLFQLLSNGAGANAVSHINGMFFECFSPNSGEVSRYSGIVGMGAGPSADSCSGPAHNVGWYANGSHTDGTALNNLNIYGNGNTFKHTNEGVVGQGLTTVNDYGQGLTNSVEGETGNDLVYTNRVREPLNKLDGSFLLGNSTTPYTSANELLSPCSEWNFASVNGAGCTNDPNGTEITRSYLHLTSATYANGWDTFGASGHGQGPTNKPWHIGDRLPKAKTTFVAIAKCNVSCTHYIQIFDVTTSSVLANKQVTFGTDWTIQTLSVDLSGTSVGDNIGLLVPSGYGLWQSGMTDEWLALYAFAPVNTDVLSQIPAATNAALAAPPAIGSSTPNIVNATTVNATTAVNTAALTATGNTVIGSGTSGSMPSLSCDANSYCGWQLINGGTRYWYLGVEQTSHDFILLDNGGHSVFNIPPNTVPSDALGGNANGLTTITQSTSDNSTSIATTAFVKGNLPLTGTTASIGGSALTAGNCASANVTATGATTSMAVEATPATDPGDQFFWKAYVSSSNTVTVKVCTDLAAGGTPTASTYNVRVIR